MTSALCNNSQVGDFLSTQFEPVPSCPGPLNGSDNNAIPFVTGGAVVPLHHQVISLPEYIQVVTTIFCIIILFVGIVGNSFIPVVMWQNRDLRNSTNIFLLNLSLADLLVLVVCLPTMFVELYSKPEVWMLGEGLCKTIPFLELLVANASVLTIVAISLERYYAIAEPLRARAYRLTRKRTLLILISVWIIAATLAGPIILVAKYNPETLFKDGTRGHTCITAIETFWEKFYFMSILVIFYIIPLFTLFIVYLVIGRHLLQSPGGEVEQNMQLKSRQQVVAMLVVVVIVFFVCLLPYKCLVVMAMVANDDQYNRMGAERFYNLLYFSRVMIYINSAINPIIYNIMSSKFRRAFLKILGFRQQSYLGSTRGQSIKSLSQSSIVRLKANSCHVKLLLFNKSDKSSHSEISSTYDKSITSKSTYMSDFDSKSSSLKHSLKVPNNNLVRKDSDDDSLHLSISPLCDFSYSDSSPCEIIKMFPRTINYYLRENKEMKSLLEGSVLSTIGCSGDQDPSPYESCSHLECKTSISVPSSPPETKSPTPPHHPATLVSSSNVYHSDIQSKTEAIVQKESTEPLFHLDFTSSSPSLQFGRQYESLV